MSKYYNFLIKSSHLCAFLRFLLLQSNKTVKIHGKNNSGVQLTPVHSKIDKNLLT